MTRLWRDVRDAIRALANNPGMTVLAIFHTGAGLGAQRQQVLSMVLREVLLLTGVGCALGIAASLFAEKLIRRILLGVSATDLFILVGAIVTLLPVAVLAGFLPALRAARVDPIAALRVS